MQTDNKTETKKGGFLRRMIGKGKLRASALAMALASLLSVGAFASDGTTTSGGGFDSVLGSFDTLASLMSRVWNLMTANPYLTLFLAVALLGMGVTVFKMVKSAAHP